MHKCIAFYFLFFSCAVANCQEEESDESPVLAMIGTEAITQAEVDFHLSRPAGSLKLSRAALENTLLLMAQQRQALQTLRKSGRAADKAELYRWLEEKYPPDDKSEGESLTAEQILAFIAKGQGVSPKNAREQIAFRLSWKRYLSVHLNRKNLARHFGNQTKRFDGTEFRIRMISLPAPAGVCTSRDKAVAQLEKDLAVVAEIDGEQELPKKSLRDGVEVMQSRWVRGMGDLDNRIVDAMLNLEEGSWSPIFHTATGVHALNLLEVEEGDKELSQVEDVVRVHMLSFLLEGLARQSAKELPLKRLSVGG